MSEFLKWLEQLAGAKALTLFLALVCIRLLNANGLIPLHEIHPSAVAVVDVALILSGAFTVLWIIEAIKRWWSRRAEAERHRQEARQFLRNLSALENGILSSMLRSNQRSFYAKLPTIRTFKC